VKSRGVLAILQNDRVAAEDPAVAEIIRKAELVFISGGDQANYIRGWKDTPVEKAINDGIAAGKPIGGTSAGLTVEGEFAYGALGDKPDDKDLASPDVLMNPYFERVTLERAFLRILFWRISSQIHASPSATKRDARWDFWRALLKMGGVPLQGKWRLMKGRRCWSNPTERLPLCVLARALTF
jgi:hypothetical protein